MFALTRALQFEIGVPPAVIADSFGDLTTSKFNENVGQITPATATNIIKILQGALYCKGYPAKASAAPTAR